MTTNFLHALEQDRRIRKGLNNSLPFPFSPNYTILPIQKYIDKDHSFLSNVKPYPSDKKDFSILYNVKTITMPKKEQPIVHVQPLSKELNLDKHYNIEKIHPVNRIPDAYYQFQMKDKTDADIRLAALQKESGTNNKFNNLLKNADTGESLEDINTNLKIVLEQIKKKKLDNSTASSSSASASASSSSLSASASDATSSILDPPKSTLIIKSNDSDNDDLIVNDLFDDSDEDYDERQNRQALFTDYNNLLNEKYSEEDQISIRRRLETKPYPIHKFNEDVPTFIVRVKKNIVAQKKREKVIIDAHEKKSQADVDAFALKHYKYSKLIDDEGKEKEKKYGRLDLDPGFFN